MKDLAPKKTINSNDPASISYYKRNKYKQITVKADTEFVERIKEIAQEEERTMQTVTNRLLRKALKLYDQEKSHFNK